MNDYTDPMVTCEFLIYIEEVYMNKDSSMKDKQALDLTMGNLKRNWGWLLALGIIFVILGGVGLGMTVFLTLASMFFFGVLFIVGGVFQLIDAVKCKEWKGLLWHILIGILYILCGAVIIYDPFLASAFITMVLGCLLIVMGISRLLMAMNLKNDSSWGWLFLAGLSAIVLGIMILAQWPMSGFWIIGLFIAIELIIAGWSYIFIAVAMRRS